MSAVGIAVEIHLPKSGDSPPQTDTAVQQIQLCPQILNAVRCRCAGQFDQPLHMRSDPRQRFESFCLAGFETAAFVDNDHVKRPCVFEIIHQPDDILPIRDVDICRTARCTDPLLCAAQNHGEPQVPQMIPLRRLCVPCSFGNFLRGNDQAPAHLQPIIDQLLYGGQCDHRFSQPHIQKQPQCPIGYDPVNAVLLVGVRRELHSGSPYAVICFCMNLSTSSCVLST